jgi:hypothetical protein
MSGCKQITDDGLAHLAGIHTLDISDCTAITAAGLAQLTGVRKLRFSQHTLDFPAMRDAAFALGLDRKDWSVYWETGL